MQRSVFALLALLAAAPAAAEQRLVSTAGPITEIVYALGAGDALVAVDSTSTYPPAAGALPQVGYMRALSAEGILSVRPTLLLASADSGPPRVFEQLAAAGVAMAVIETAHDSAGVAGRIRRIARLIGRADAGDALAASVSARFTRIAAAVHAAPSRPRVLFVIGAGRGAPMAAGTGTAADAMIRLAGGTNAVTAYHGYKPLSVEAAAAAAPDVLLAMSQTLADIGGESAFLALPSIAVLPAARAGRLIAMDGMYLLGFGPRTPEALADLARALHPGLALD